MGRFVVIPLTVDRLKVFVSSTIKECATERAAVRDAIRSINHEPILFEDIGARPHPPRDVYKARLEISQIFVGIYKESYGWIAPEMDVSGVEDEFRLAAAQGMNRLIYIYKTPSSRDPKLQILIDEAKNAGITLATYTKPAQLKDRVRNDLTAVVSNRFADQAVVLREAPKPEEVLDSLIPNTKHRLRRPDVEGVLIDTLNECGRIVVTAPFGGGKTILLAQLSAEKEWIFVDGQGLNRLDLLARSANAIRERLGRPPVTLITEQIAIQELLKSWDGLPDSTLAVDGATEPLVLWEIPAKNRQLVVTSRSTLGVPSNQRFDLPRLTGDEIVAWVTALRGIRPDPGELSSLAARSGGSPLYLRFFALREGASADLSLQELEVRAFQSLPPQAREITSYLALSPRPLSLKDLLTLVGAEEGPEAVAEQVSTASGLLRQIRGQVMLVHEHLRTTILDQLHQASARLAFFANHLGQFFENSERYLAAFHVYFEADEHRHADRVLERAANQAVLMGGGAPAIPVFRRQADLAQESGALEKRLYALLALAFAFKQTGARDDAGRALDQAQAAAERLNEPGHFLRVREMEAVLDIDAKLRSERIAELNALRNSYAENSDLFNAARTGTLLAAEYISGRDYQSAEKVSREVLQVFIDLGDEHGKRAAQLNLAAALSGIEGREEEAASIAQEVQKKLAPEEYPREHAVLCNYLTRHYRESGDTAHAAEFALEAIQIGEQLGDHHVIAINRHNLGNIRRDEGKLGQALIEYHAAAKVAFEGPCCMDHPEECLIIGFSTLGVVQMPHKFNAARRHKFDKVQYRVINWAEYNESLRQRGDLTIWVSEEAQSVWSAPRRTSRGGQRRYSDLAIETCLMLRTAYHLGLRQTQGLMGSIGTLMGLDIRVPDYSTLSRRANGVSIAQVMRQAGSVPIHLVVDSTGLKIFGEGEWLAQKHNTKGIRRRWRKLHLGLDLASGAIVCAALTHDNVGDSTALPGLLDQLDAPVTGFLADGAYDGASTRNLLRQRYGETLDVVIPPPKDAVIRLQSAHDATVRDRHIAQIRSNGCMAWQTATGYNQRSRIETQMGRWKSVIGPKLKSRSFSRQITEVQLGRKVLNTMTALGRPVFERIS